MGLGEEKYLVWPCFIKRIPFEGTMGWINMEVGLVQGQDHELWWNFRYMTFDLFEWELGAGGGGDDGSYLVSTLSILKYK